MISGTKLYRRNFFGREENATNNSDFGFTGYNRNLGIDRSFNFASNYYLTFPDSSESYKRN